MNLSHNRKIIKAIVFFVISSIGILFILGSSGLNNSKFSEAQEVPKNYELPQDAFTYKKEEKLVEPQAESKFVIKEHNGSVAVFENGKKNPIKETETLVADLPLADREILKKGINVSSKEELLRILEDYCS